MNLKIKKLDKDLPTPCYANEGDAGFDLYSTKDFILKPGEKKLVGTGISIAIPPGHTGLIWDRSGLAAKHELHVLAGVIDTGYRGEVGVVLKNLSAKDFEVTKGMRIAQMIIQPFVSVVFNEVDSLDEDTDRKAGGFGSSGK
jgi:dUTP pyrophosphatase